MTKLSRPASVSRELYKKFQHFCIDKEVSAREALENAIELYMNNEGGKKK